MSKIPEVEPILFATPPGKWGVYAIKFHCCGLRLETNIPPGEDPDLLWCRRCGRRYSRIVIGRPSTFSRPTKKKTKRPPTPVFLFRDDDGHLEAGSGVRIELQKRAPKCAECAGHVVILKGEGFAGVRAARHLLERHRVPYSIRQEFPGQSVTLEPLD